VKVGVVAFVAGLVFAIGLGISGMTQPSKVVGFLDFTGAWDPSLAFVMMGAIGVHFYFARRALVSKRPLFAERFAWPEKVHIDAPLVVGAILFGVGWGLAGYCPGPAIVSAASLAPTTLAFFGAMIASMFVFEMIIRAQSRS